VTPRTGAPEIQRDPVLLGTSLRAFRISAKALGLGASVGGPGLKPWQGGTSTSDPCGWFTGCTSINGSCLASWGLPHGRPPGSPEIQ